MSGVFGVISDEGRSGTGDLLSAMREKMSHRPWFQAEIFSDEEAGVGLGRIGIGIFNPEMQPVVSEDNSILLFMAGEFYDYAELRSELETQGYHFRDFSDAEFALRLYQDRGPEFVKVVEGIFVTAIWDRSRQQLFIANDRFGFKPLYYAQFDHKFIFAPEIKGILADGTFSKKLNMTAVAEYMRFQQLLGEKTFFEGVILLEPASVLCLDRATFQLTRHTYWDWRSIRSRAERLDRREIAVETERLLQRAVNTRLERTVKPGILLSGGLDSRTILALAARQHWPITTITYGHHACRDVYLAGRVARAAGTQHHFFELRDGNWVKEVAGFHLELVEGAHSWIHAHSLSILPQVRQLIDVNLSGFGAGAMTGFFERPSMIYAPDEEALVNATFQYYTQRHSWPGLTEAEAYGLYADGYSSLLKGLALNSLRAELAKFDHPDTRLRSFFFNLLNHDRRMILNFILFNNSHIENRCPFDDYRLVEWMASLPMELKADKQIHRSILSHVAPRLALIPYDRTYRLPTNNELLRGIHAMYTRTVYALGKQLKIGNPRPTLYADYENYLRHELRDWAEAILFDERTLARGIFRPKALRSLMDRHLSGREEWTIGKIAPLITFEMMMRRFFDESTV